MLRRYFQRGWPQTEGQSVFDLIGTERAATMRAMVKENGGARYVPLSDASRWGLTDPDDVAWVNGKATPQPVKTYEDAAPSTVRALEHHIHRVPVGITNPERRDPLAA